MADTRIMNLSLRILVKETLDNILKYFFFSQKRRLDISFRKVSPVCCEKNKKNITNLSSAELPSSARVHPYL